MARDWGTIRRQFVDTALDRRHVDDVRRGIDEAARPAEPAPRVSGREGSPDVHSVVAELHDVYTEEGIETWLRARNRNLDGARPIDLITAGDLDAVRQEAQRLNGAM